jgi:hypothetical protein
MGIPVEVILKAGYDVVIILSGNNNLCTQTFAHLEKELIDSNASDD